MLNVLRDSRPGDERGKSSLMSDVLLLKTQLAIAEKKRRRRTTSSAGKDQ